MTGKIVGGFFPDLRDGEADDEARQGDFFCFGYREKQIVDRLLRKARKEKHVAALQRENIVKVHDQSFIQKKIDDLRPHTVNIEGMFADKMREFPSQLCERIFIDAAPRGVFRGSPLNSPLSPLGEPLPPEGFFLSS